MAFDLFFLPKKMAFAETQSADFFLDARERRAQARILRLIEKQFLDCKFVGQIPQSGYMQSFPMGQLDVHRGYLFWSLHASYDLDKIKSIVDWFFAQGWACIDPQGGGFSNQNVKMRMTPFQGPALFKGATILRAEFEYQTLVLHGTTEDGRVIEFTCMGVCQEPSPDALTAIYKLKIVDSARVPDPEIFEKYVLFFEDASRFEFLAAWVQGRVEDRE
jgi:hypothetical protein